MKTTRWWELEEPEDVLAQTLKRARPAEGDVVVARVDVEAQNVTGTRVLAVPTAPKVIGRWDDETRWRRQSRLSDVVREAAEKLAPAREWSDNGRGGFTGVFITLVCRQGRVVDTKAEWQWLTAWRYSNHFRDGFDGDVYVVTPHGWTGIMDERRGVEPVLPGSSPLRLLAGEG
jgi:hypothetical protein